MFTSPHTPTQKRPLRPALGAAHLLPDSVPFVSLGRRGWVGARGGLELNALQTGIWAESWEARGARTAGGWPSRSFSPEEGDGDSKSFLTGLTLSTPTLGTSLRSLRSPTPDRAQLRSGPTFLTQEKAPSPPPPTSPPLPSALPQALLQKRHQVPARSPGVT